MKLTLLASLLIVSGGAQAATCHRIDYQPNKVVSVQSALMMGTRLQLPADLIAKPLTSNSELWNVEGVIGTNQIVIKPNSSTPQGAQTMIFAYTSDGNVYDINARRVAAKNNEPCAIINPDGVFFNKDNKKHILGFIADVHQQAGGAEAEAARLRTQMVTVRNNSKIEKKRAVRDALRKYRFHIYTRYDWNEGKAFVGNNTVSDVYDDGRFTYIRLANPNRGVLSVETQIGGKTAIAPTKYDNAYGMYQINGIYPAFTLRVDNVAIDVNRRDNGTKGAS